jgi:hypothetical protein
MKNAFILPNGDLIHGSDIATVNHFVGSGVMIKGSNGNNLSYVAVNDDEVAIHIRSELVKVVMAIANKEKYLPNFELPKVAKK